MGLRKLHITDVKEFKQTNMTSQVAIQSFAGLSFIFKWTWKETKYILDSKN